MKLNSKSKKKLAAIAVVTLLLVTAMGYVIYSFMQPRSSGNYAEDIAKPLEEALAKAGANRVCTGGDDGKGWDNDVPYYGATYTLKSDKESVIKLADQIAQDQGFKLQHASPTNRGPLSSIADIYIERWYFDTTSKESPYTDLEKGTIQLTSSVAGPGEKNTCNQDEVLPADTTMVGFGVSLPEFKQRQ